MKTTALRFTPIKNDLLAGLVTAFALIPEVIAFAILAGVDPKVGLYASFCTSIVIAFTGGRPGMISAAAGSMAMVMVLLVKEHGTQYLLVTTVLTGIIQIVAGWFKLGNLMRFVSRSVINGFLNSLAILIFVAQLPELIHVSWQVYALTLLGLAIIYLFPYVTKAIPSALVAIVVVTVISISCHLTIHTIGDKGALPDSLPSLMWPTVPLNWATLKIILPIALTLAAVGILESLLTQNIVDEVTDTPSNKNRECVGQGIANIATGMMGGTAGCAMIGQTMINLKSGGRGRLSTLSAGVFLLILSVGLGHWVAEIPMAALVAVMITVSVSTFNWRSLRDIRKMPLSSTVVMLVTVVVVVITQDLAKGVLAGVVLSGLFFANKVERVLMVSSHKNKAGNLRVYTVVGQVFFASAERFTSGFHLKEKIQTVHINISKAYFWDVTAVAALDSVIQKMKQEGIDVSVVGASSEQADILKKYSVQPIE